MNHISNEILWVLMLMLTYSTLLIFYKVFGKIGLFAWIAIAVILSNLQVLIQVDILYLHTTLSTVSAASCALSVGILTEQYGRENAKKGVLIGFLAFLSFAIFTNIPMLFQGNEFNTRINSYKEIFSTAPVLLIASLIGYIVSLNINIIAYEIFRKKFPKFLFVRNNLATLISQFIDTMIFIALATLFGVFNSDIFLSLVVSSYILKAITALLDTPFIYIAKNIKTID